MHKYLANVQVSKNKNSTKCKGKILYGSRVFRTVHKVLNHFQATKVNQSNQSQSVIPKSSSVKASNHENNLDILGNFTPNAILDMVA
jgi:hypothetical protein